MRMIFDLDMDRCVACGACAVACMDQNDRLPEDGEALFRTDGIVESPPGGRELGCMHCAAAPCIAACPTGCLRKDALRLTVCDNGLCIGCRSCAMACPLGAPVFQRDGRLRKYDGCQVRQENGLESACVQICPTGTLTCCPEADYLADKRTATLKIFLFTNRESSAILYQG